MTHELVGKSLFVEKDPEGGKGIIGRCTCGWNTGYRFTSLSASAAFRDHQESMRSATPTKGE